MFLFIICLMIIFPIITQAWHTLLIEYDNKPSVRTKNIPKEKVLMVGEEIY